MGLTHAKIELRNPRLPDLAPVEINALADTGSVHTCIPSRIRLQLQLEERETKEVVLTDGIGFHVQLPHREAFSPDAVYHMGPRTGMRFLEGAPIFAVEVRSEHDDGPAAERAMQEKRADYFACGTLVVWDMDLRSEEVIQSYRAGDPENPVTFRLGDTAHAELAVPGWRLAVDALFG